MTVVHVVIDVDSSMLSTGQRHELSLLCGVVCDRIVARPALHESILYRPTINLNLTCLGIYSIPTVYFVIFLGRSPEAAPP